VSEPTTPSGRDALRYLSPGAVGGIGRNFEWESHIVAIEAEARALLLDELEAAVRGMLRTDVDDVSVLALIQQHREAVR
jgi:hypothetical protein